LGNAVRDHDWVTTTACALVLLASAAGIFKYMPEYDEDDVIKQLTSSLTVVVSHHTT
jgi:hypothetical protein